jgi:hypothetical protein
LKTIIQGLYRQRQDLFLHDSWDVVACRYGIILSGCFFASSKGFPSVSSKSLSEYTTR